MTLRIGWLSPLTPASGVGTFSHAVSEKLPESCDGERLDVTMLHLGHEQLYPSRHRTILIQEGSDFHQILGLFDLLIYNIGNNRQHHHVIFDLLRVRPGIVICHDYVYQHYMAERSLTSGRSFGSYAGLLTKYASDAAEGYIRRSRITSRTGGVRYSPWDTEASVFQPMSEAILDLGSALVVHSRFALEHAERRFDGPILRLGMPHDQKQLGATADLSAWHDAVAAKPRFQMVSFGHIQSTKCLDMVIEAIAASKLLRGRVRYTVAGMVGDGEYFRQLQDLVAQAGLHGVVTFETNVSEARLGELLQTADFFINLRKPNTEGSSASLIEQLDSGKPVVVLDSGSYAEISSGAAVKLPPDASARDVELALERLIARPERMAAIGLAGRAHARAWTCASYGEHLVRFAFAHRALLEHRARAIGISTRREEEAASDPWIRNLACARTTLRYLDRNVLAVDPGVLIGQTREALCTYVAHVIFGIFDDLSLHHALARFFAGRTDVAVYWACVKLGLIVEAVFEDSEAARERLRIMGPCYDPAFWDVVEHLPPAQYFMTAKLLLVPSLPPPEQFVAPHGRARGGASKRLQLLPHLDALPADDDGAITRLRHWLERPEEAALAADLATIERSLDCTVGDGMFSAHAGLSNFYKLEPDHAWTRGTRGFVGLRLGSAVSRVEVLVRHVDACAARPTVLSLSSGTATVDLEVADDDLHWIGLDIAAHLAEPRTTTWLRLSAARAGSPPNSADTRSLGLCFYRLRVLATAAAASSPPSPSAVPRREPRPLEAEGAARRASPR